MAGPSPFNRAGVSQNQFMLDSNQQHLEIFNISRADAKIVTSAGPNNNNEE